VVYLCRLKVEFFLLQKIINQVKIFFKKKKKCFVFSSGDQAERQRIQEAGGTVLIQRVNGSLAVSRALGDFEYKNNPNRRPDQQLVSPEPEITCHTRNLTTNSGKQDEHVAFIVLACDGIWDVMTNEELAAYILGRMHVTDDLSEISNSVLDMCLYKVCLIIFLFDFNKIECFRVVKII
jgi:hypothetical protein